MQHSIRAFALTSLLALAACSDNDGDSQGEVDMKAARDQWEAAQVHDYHYTLKISCFCAPGVPTDISVVVTDGSVSSATDRATGEPVPEEDFGDIPTVDGLFELLAEAYDEDADEVVADYDGDRGYPLMLHVDYNDNIGDDEIGYTVEDLVQITPGS